MKTFLIHEQRDRQTNSLGVKEFDDAQTYTSAHALMRPRTINDKGTLDEYRRPKLAYDQVQRAFRGRFRVCGGIIC